MCVFVCRVQSVRVFNVSVFISVSVSVTSASSHLHSLAFAYYVFCIVLSFALSAELNGARRLRACVFAGVACKWRQGQLETNWFCIVQLGQPQIPLDQRLARIHISNFRWRCAAGGLIHLHQPQLSGDAMRNEFWLLFRKSWLQNQYLLAASAVADVACSEISKQRTEMNFAGACSSSGASAAVASKIFYYNSHKHSVRKNCSPSCCGFCRQEQTRKETSEVSEREGKQQADWHAWRIHNMRKLSTRIVQKHVGMQVWRALD